MNYFDTQLSSVQTPTMLTMRGLPLDPAILTLAGIVPMEYPEPAYTPDTHTIEPDGDPQPNADGTAYVQAFKVVELPVADALRNVKTAKRAELTTAFVAAEASGWLASSLGWDIDATERANRDVAGLVTVMSQPEAPETTYFCDHHNQMRPVTLADLKAMQLEIIAYGQSLYAQKWQLRTAIETAETMDAVRAVVIAFGADPTGTDTPAPEASPGTDTPAPEATPGTEATEPISPTGPASEATA